MVLAIPYLIVKNGKKSIKLYEDLFGAKVIELMPFTKEMGKQFGLPDDFDYENSILHAELEINGGKIMITDNMEGETGGGNVEVLLQLESKEQIDTIYGKAKKKGFKIKMELEKTFWGAYFARFEDSDGIGWQLNFQEDPR